MTPGNLNLVKDRVGGWFFENLACELRTSGTNNFSCVFSWRIFSDPCRGAQGASTSFDGWIATCSCTRIVPSVGLSDDHNCLLRRHFGTCFFKWPGFVQCKCASHSELTFFILFSFWNLFGKFLLIMGTAGKSESESLRFWLPCLVAIGMNRSTTTEAEKLIHPILVVA